VLVAHRQKPLCLDNADTDCRQKLWKKVHLSQTIEEDRVAEGMANGSTDDPT